MRHSRVDEVQERGRAGGDDEGCVSLDAIAQYILIH